MPRQRTVPADHAAFADLPITHVTLLAGVCAAVHVAGQLSSRRLPVVCIAGYQRNMSDFSAFAAYFRRVGGGEWPVVLIDLPGRGRADDRLRAEDYSSLADADDVASVMAALGVGPAVMLGQGHGGQVAMALATRHPRLIAGTVLLDAGPVTDSRGIVRLRNNLAHIESLQGAAVVTAGFRRILGGDYPGLADDRLNALIGRSHMIDKRGRARPLFDRRLIEALASINFDDVLMAQWPLFDALRCAPLMLLRTQLTDQLRRETFDEMSRRRPDAVALTIAGQGSPALFDQREEIEAVAEFVIRTSMQVLGRAA
ncbi:MAG: alpha/beta hydrolase [Alphaproteobacteria bacterium]|nr:alpha/beta hydrolase [Alphaproteobacteria bacterium]MBU1559246.1 alpha/beta hydrolase [Alphaproteobacteria bacterium]MBU2303186.1 alpha/beta hydrolase [Alphaproteobacteria bacterium]MBU2366576.1 alpha/beta hydrolase [Alphaproteobacteria bacterium]